MWKEKMQSIFRPRWINWVFRIALSLVFGYFGWLAVSEPATQVNLWLSSLSYKIIGAIMPLTWFMIGLGVVQLAVASALFWHRALIYALPLYAVLLIGIIVNLGWNELALRDLAILAGVLYLYSRELEKI